MLQKLKNHLNKNFPFLQGSKLLITVSGGVDSIVLTHLLHQLSYNIGIAHCNFQLRGTESNLDEAFVKKTASELNCKLHHIQFSTREYCIKNKVNTQIGARELRYEWFKKLQQEFEYDYILTAHHLNDVMETFFINLARGTGLNGLASIPAINNNIIRPLLVFSRENIENFATENSIKWREDQSNAETKYIRNKIRHNITPELYKLHPNFEENFLNTIINIHECKDFIKQKIELLQKNIFVKNENGFTIRKSILKTLSDFEIYELFKPFNFTSTIEIKKLTTTQTGKQIHSNTHSLLNNRESLVLYIKQQRKEDYKTYNIQNTEDINHLPISLNFTSEKQEISNSCIALNMSKLSFPLVLRKREDGDFFHPLGMNGKKKVSKYLKDQKLSLLEKKNIWLLCNQQQEIIWIVNHRASNIFCSKTNTTNTIYAIIKPH